MTVFSQTLTDSADDANESQGGSGFSSTGTTVITRANAVAALRYNSGWYVSGVTIPNGATVSNAVLKLTNGHSTNDDMNCKIHIHDVDDSTDFAADADVTSRARSSGSVDWDLADAVLDTQYTSPDFSSLLTTHFARAGWASGNGLTIILVGEGDDSSRFDAYGADNGSGYAEIEITYTAAAGGAGAIMTTMKGIW